MSEMCEPLFQCTKRKRSIGNLTLADGARYFETSKLLHIAPEGSGASSVLGRCQILWDQQASPHYISKKWCYICIR